MIGTAAGCSLNYHQAKGGHPRGQCSHAVSVTALAHELDCCKTMEKVSATDNRRRLNVCSRRKPSSLACDDITNWEVRMLDKNTQLRFLSIFGLTVNEDNAILVNEPINDELHEICLLIKLRLCLDVIFDLLHVPSNQILLFHLFTLLLLPCQFGCEHLTDALVFRVSNLHLARAPCA